MSSKSANMDSVTSSVEALLSNQPPHQQLKILKNLYEIVLQRENLILCSGCKQFRLAGNRCTSSNCKKSKVYKCKFCCKSYLNIKKHTCKVYIQSTPQKDSFNLQEVHSVQDKLDFDKSSVNFELLNQNTTDKTFYEDKPSYNFDVDNFEQTLNYNLNQLDSIIF